MNRRAFLGNLIGGVATAAAVRTWPFRVFSFPTEVKPVKLDLGFNVFDYAGLPMFTDAECPNSQIFFLSEHLWHSDGKIVTQLSVPVKPMAHCRIEGLQV